MPSLNELREQRANASARITDLAKRINDEKREFTPGERSNWDAANGDYDRLGRDIQIQERAEKVAAEQKQRADDPVIGREDSDPRKGEKSKRDRATPTEEQRSLAFRAWCKSQKSIPLSRREVETCREIRFNPNTKELRIQLWPDSKTSEVGAKIRDTVGERQAAVRTAESRANMSAQIGPSGGYLTAPGQLSSALETNLLAFGGVRLVAEVMSTTSGEPFFWPTVDDTSNSGALLSENTQAISSGVIPSIGRKMWSAYKFTSKPILIGTELLEDSQFELPTYLGELLGIRLGRGTAPYYATGTGDSQPEGIVTGASLGVTTASATSIKWDDLIGLIHSIDPAYRSMPGVGFLVHDSVIAYIRQIKDGQGRPMWLQGNNYVEGNRSGVPDKLLQYQVNVCQELDSTVTTGKKTVLFGVLSKYKIRRVNDVRLYHLTERFRDLDQDGFVAFLREDGKLLNAGTAPVKYIQQA